MYRSIVGSLQYIAARTRQELAVAKTMSSWYTSGPKVSHIVVAKRVPRYLNGTKTKRLLLRPG